MEKEEEEMDIFQLFCHYNTLYFEDTLGACFLNWSSDLMTSCTGTCHYYPEGGCKILLSEPLLKISSTTDLKNTLLHEMVHAFLWIKFKNKDHSDHGSTFQKMRNLINSSSLRDHQRPCGGYNIAIHHELKKEGIPHEPKKEFYTYKFTCWTCDSCGDSMKICREPSARDCICKVGSDKSCRNLSCRWHNHKNACSGHYIAELTKGGDKKISSQGEKGMHVKFKESTCTSKQTTERVSETEAMKRKSTIISDYNVTSYDDDYDNDNFQESNCEQLKVSTIKTQKSMVTAERSKRVKYAALGWKQEFASNKKRRRRDEGKWKICTVPGEWFCLFGDEEEEDENVEPLRNKRSERRKRLKQLQAQQQQRLMEKHKELKNETDEEYKQISQ